MPVYIQTYMHAYMHAYIHTYIHYIRHTYLPTYLPPSLPACLPTYIPTYLPAHLHAYIQGSWSLKFVSVGQEYPAGDGFLGDALSVGQSGPMTSGQDSDVSRNCSSFGLTLAARTELRWETPKIRGPNMYPKIVGLLL